MSGGEFIHTYCALVFTPGAPVFMAATQGTVHDHLALMASRASIHGPQGTITHGETVLGWLPPPRGMMQRQQTKTHAQSFCERGLFLILELLVGQTSRGLLRCSLGTEAGGLNLCTSPPSLWVTSTSKGGACVLTGHLNFYNCHIGDST